MNKNSELGISVSTLEQMGARAFGMVKPDHTGLRPS
jgi:hypothetical protein